MTHSKPQLTWHQMLDQLGDAGQRRAPVQAKRTRVNPRPQGVIQPGSATSTLLKFLTARPGRVFRREQLVLLTGCTPKALDWALLFLRQNGSIECVTDERNPRYLRYRLAAGTAAAIVWSQSSPAAGRQP